MIKQSETLLGVKIPKELKKRVATYCDRNGVKIKYFVAEAIQDKLSEKLEDYYDIMVTNERLKNPKFVSEEEMDKYIEKRRKQGY